MHVGSTEISTREWLEGRLARLLGGLPGSWLLKALREPAVQIDGQTLDPHLQFILAARRLKGTRLLCEPTPESGRRRYRREVLSVEIGSGARPTRVKAVRNLTVPGAAGDLAARLYTPPSVGQDAAAHPLLVFLHGGGFVIGDLDTHDEPCRLLCHHSGMLVLSVTYRLAPEHPFPAGLDDAVAIIRWAQEHAASLGASPTQVCVSGDSAGANLVTAASFMLAREGHAPHAQLLVYPACDMRATYPSLTTLFTKGFVLTEGDMHAFRRHYLGGDESLTADPRASPLRTADLHHAPPAMIVTAGFDPLRDEGEAYAEALREAGVCVVSKRMRSMVHGFLHMTTVSPGARAAVVEIARTFRAHADAVRRPESGASHRSLLQDDVRV